jgi:hypothetical protein
MKTLVRPEILGLAEYHLAQYPHRIKLNQNENPYELPAEIKREVLDRLAAERWSRYPAFIPQEQINLVAQHAGWVPEGTLLGNGSNDLLQLLFMALLERGKSVVISRRRSPSTRSLPGVGADVKSGHAAGFRSTSLDHRALGRCGDGRALFSQQRRERCLKKRGCQ